jgi:hypothetical protein
MLCRKYLLVCIEWTQGVHHWNWKSSRFERNIFARSAPGPRLDKVLKIWSCLKAQLSARSGCRSEIILIFRSSGGVVWPCTQSASVHRSRDPLTQFRRRRFKDQNLWTIRKFPKSERMKNLRRRSDNIHRICCWKEDWTIRSASKGAKESAY